MKILYIDKILNINAIDKCKKIIVHSVAKQLIVGDIVGEQVLHGEIPLYLICSGKLIIVRRKY